MARPCRARAACLRSGRLRFRFLVKFDRGVGRRDIDHQLYHCAGGTDAEVPVSVSVSVSIRVSVGDPGDRYGHGKRASAADGTIHRRFPARRQFPAQRL